MAEYLNQRRVAHDTLSWRTARGPLLAFLAAMTAACLLINVLVTRPLWRPALPRFDQAIAETRAMAGRVDTLFLGPSHVLNEVNPATFDRVAAELGHPTVSYNYSAEALRVPERDFLLDELAAMRLPNLRYVLVKPDLWLLSNEANMFSARTRYFDRPETVARLLRLRLQSNRGVAYVAGSSARLLFGGALHLANIGVVADVALPRVPALQREAAEHAMPGIRGFEPLKMAGRDFPKGGKPEPYPPMPPVPRSDQVRHLTRAEVEAVGDVFARIRALGAQPIALFPPHGGNPVVESMELIAAIRTHFPDVPVLAYQEGMGPREFYDSTLYWFNLDHLNAVGAERFTELLARDFVTRIREGKGQLP